MIKSAKLQKENVRPEELISDDLLAVTVTELHVTDHQDSVEDHGQCNDPRDMCIAVNIQCFCQAPVEDAHESPEECYQEAEVAMTPDPDREGKKHDPDIRDIGEAVEEDHPVHQRVLLDFEPDKDNDIDDKDS